MPVPQMDIMPQETPANYTEPKGLKDEHYAQLHILYVVISSPNPYPWIHRIMSLNVCIWPILMKVAQLDTYLVVVSWCLCR